MWAGTLRELGDLDEARRLNEEAIELASSSSFPPGVASGEIDLLFADIALGEVGRAEAAWPELWQTAQAASGWHEWLWLIRLDEAKAEIELARGRLDQAAAAAAATLARAERHARRKYVVASRLTLGSALLGLSRHTEAVQALRRALEDAERLGHPPSIARAAGLLAQALLAARDEDAAGDAYRRARETIESFCAGLSEERHEQFLRTTAMTEILALDQPH